MHHFHVSANHYLIFLVDPGTSVTLYRADERKKKEIKRKREREIFLKNYRSLKYNKSWKYLIFDFLYRKIL